MKTSNKILLSVYGAAHLFLLYFFVALKVWGGDGSGHKTKFFTESYTINEFTGIKGEYDKSIRWSFQIKSGANYAVEAISADSTFLNHIDVSVENGVLEVKKGLGSPETYAVQLNITVPDISSINLKNTSDIDIRNMTINDLDLVVTNSHVDLRNLTIGKMKADIQNGNLWIKEGEADYLDIHLKNSASSNLNMPVKELALKMEGSRLYIQKHIESYKKLEIDKQSTLDIINQ